MSRKGRGRGGERIPSRLKPHARLYPKTLRLRPELKPRVRRITDNHPGVPVSLASAKTCPLPEPSLTFHLKTVLSLRETLALVIKKYMLPNISPG